jgi:hypothetical protein
MGSWSEMGRVMLAVFVALVAVAAVACDAGEPTLPVGDPAKLTALKDVKEHACACKDPACSYRVLGELLAYSDAHKDLRDSKAAVAMTDELEKCLDVAARADPMAGGGVDGGVGVAGGGPTGMPACDEYLALVERYLNCDQFPQAARDSTRQATDAMRQAWRDMANMPPDVRRTADDACKQASDAMRQAGQAMGCDLPPPPP